MSPVDFKPAENFRELHLLPRVIFTIGSALIIGSFFVKSVFLGLCGIDAIFIATLYNLIVDSFLSWQAHRKLNYMLLSHCVIAAAFFIATFCFAYHVYFHGGIPGCTQPATFHVPF